MGELAAQFTANQPMVTPLGPGLSNCTANALSPIPASVARVTAAGTSLFGRSSAESSAPWMGAGHLVAVERIPGARPAGGLAPA